MLTNLVSGDSASWDDTPFAILGKLCDSSGYTLTYELRGPNILTLTAAASSKGWTTSITPAQSAALGVGKYWWAAILSSATERITAAIGEMTVSANLTTQIAGYDGRSIAEKALSDAENALASFRATRGRTKKYIVGSRTMEFDSAAEIITEINFWRIKVRNERAASDIANGLGAPDRLYVRFGR